MKHTQKKDPLTQQAGPGIKTTAPRILLAEDDEEMRRILVRALCREGYEVEESSDGMDLLDRLYSSLFLRDRDKREIIDLIVSDIRMPGVTGMEVLEGLHKCRNRPPMILITAFGDEATHMMAKDYGVAALFDKPFDVDALIAKVNEIVSTSGGAPDSQKKSNQKNGGIN